MKKSIFGKIGAAAVVLTLVTSSLVGGTFAKYTSEVTGAAKATVAKWSVEFDDAEKSLSQSKDIVLTNENTTNAPTATGTIAPGSQGKVQIEVDGSQSQVGYSYTISGDVSGMNGIPLKFYTDKEMTTPLTITDNKFATAKKDMAYNTTAESMKDTVAIYWIWDKDSTDTADSGLGSNPVTGTISLTMTAEQITAPADTPVAP